MNKLQTNKQSCVCTNSIAWPVTDTELSKALSDYHIMKECLSLLFTGDWRQLYQCEICRSYWITAYFGRYGEFSYFFKANLDHKDVNEAFFLYPHSKDPHIAIHERLNGESLNNARKEEESKYGAFLPLVNLVRLSTGVIGALLFITTVGSIVSVAKLCDRISWFSSKSNNTKNKAHERF